MAHTPDCPPEHGDKLAWKSWALEHWPQGQISEVDVSGLSATANNVTNANRMLACGATPWVGVWGNFAGLRLGVSANADSFQVMPGAVFPYPFGGDLYFSKDMGGAGIASFALFTT